MTDLENAVNRNNLWRQPVLGEKMAVGVVDLSDIRAPRYARLDGRSMMYAAGLPEIAILLAAYVAFEDGSPQENPEIHEDLVAMIRTSNNSAATRMIDRIGFDKIQAVLLDPRYRFYERGKRGGLWVGKRYAKQGHLGQPVQEVREMENLSCRLREKESFKTCCQA